MKKVRCIETGAEFPSAKAAAESLGLVTIGPAIRKGTKAGGKTWEYVTAGAGGGGVKAARKVKPSAVLVEQAAGGIAELRTAIEAQLEQLDQQVKKLRAAYEALD